MTERLPCWIVLAAVVLLTGVGTALASDLETQFAEANARMGQEGPESALKSYESLMKTYDLLSPGLYYNAGIAAARSGKLGWSSWAFRQTLSSTSSQELKLDARHNLEVVAEQLKQRSREKRPRFQVVWESPRPLLAELKSQLPLRLLLWLLGGVGLLAATLLLLGKTRGGTALGIVYGVGLALTVASGTSDSPARGVVVHPSPLLLEGTHGDANRITPAPAEGQIVQFQGNTHPEFLRVVLPDGSEGWMPRDHIKELTHE